MSHQQLSLNLRGGLGNQLFGIYAAFALEDELNVSIDVSLAGIDRSHELGNFDATNFHFGRNLNVRNSRHIKERISRNRLVVNSAGQSVFLSNILNVTHLFEDDKHHSNLITEVRKSIKENRNRIMINGFFQDFCHYNKVITNVKPFALAEHSQWLEQNLELAKVQRPIMIHIRLGDYLINGLQILTKDYYNRALLDISRVADSDNVWVFSDSPEAARMLLDLPKNKFVKFLEKNEKSSETLILMREGVGLICSNSTFSCWAGITSSEKRPIMIPKKFSSDGRAQIRSIPENWNELEI